MTKSEFLQILEHRLGNVKSDTREDILSDFREHFDSAAECGLSEEEICRLLGKPEDISDEFIADISGVARNVPEHSLKTEGTAGMAFGVRRENADNAGRYHFAPVSTADIDKIVMVLRNASVNLIPGGGDILIDTEDEWRDRFALEVSDGKLIFSEKPSESHSPQAYTYTGKLFVGKQLKVSRMSVNVHMPTDFSGKISLQTTSGSVSANGFTALGKFTIKTSSGAVGMKDLYSEKLSVATGSGSDKYENVRVGGKFEAAGGSGGVSLEKCFAGDGFGLSKGSGKISVIASEGELEAAAGSGSVSVVDHTGDVTAAVGSGTISVTAEKISNELSCAAGSGSINVNVQKASEDINTSAGSGNISVIINELAADFNAGTGSGDISAAIGEDSDIRLKLVTGRSGKVLNDFNGTRNPENARYKVHLSTHSGNITVKSI